MKLIKINTDHYIIVDDSEIKEGDFVYDSKDKVIRFVKQYLPDEWIKKITHSTQPLYKNDFWAIQELKLSEVKELIGEVDVEKRAKNHLDEQHNNEDIAHPELYDAYHSFLKGYNQALEDNKDRKYTETDIKNAIIRAYSMMGNTIDVGYFNEVIQSLQPKTEWEVEYDENGKLKLV